MNRRDFQRLAAVRLDEARVLLEAEKFEGCYYLSGYVVECALKACIAKKTRKHDFPDRVLTNNSYSHDLVSLLRSADLDGLLQAELAKHPEFQANWYIVKVWSEQSRYQFNSESDAVKLFHAVKDRRHGVLRWLRQYW